MVSYHGFGSFKADDTGINAVFDRLKSIQIDPINICGRNHELVLQSRMNGFTADLLNGHLYKKRSLIEGWEKQASIFPTEEWPYFQRRRKEYREYIKSSDRGKALHEALPVVIKEIEKRGPLSSAQIEYDAVIDWRWAPAKAARAAMDALFDMGELVIAGREHNRKIYDLAERVLPAALLKGSDPNPADDEYNDYRILRRVKSMGLIWNRAGSGWLDTCKTAERNQSLKRLENRELIFPVNIDGIRNTFYIPEEGVAHIGSGAVSNAVSLLAPLDNMLWDRSMINEIFGFDYTWEVYKPAHTRQYGYYVLPVLAKDKFIGRIEPVMHKKNDTKHGIDAGTLEIRNWWPEGNRQMSGSAENRLRKAIDNFARFLNAKNVRLPPNKFHPPS